MAPIVDLKPDLNQITDTPSGFGVTTGFLGEEQSDTNAPLPRPRPVQGVDQLGMLEPGNIDLSTRTPTKLPDGRDATVRSISINVDGREILIPTIDDAGNVLSDDEAVALYQRSGRHLGIFDSADNASAFGVRLSAAESERIKSSPSLIGALFRQENTIGSFLSSHERGVSFEPDADFTASGGAWNAIKGTKYEKHFNNFADVHNRNAMIARMRQIDMEEEDRKIIAASPWYMTLPLGLVAGTLDLTTLLPGGAFIRGAKGGFAIGKSALSTGTAAGLAVGIQEGALHNQQNLRTMEESAVAVGAGVLLGGLLGAGGAALLTRGELRAGIRAIEGQADALNSTDVSVILRGRDPLEIKDAAYIQGDILNKLREAGLNEEEAATNAALMAVNYSTFAKRYGNGVSAREIYDAENLQIKREVFETPAADETIYAQTNRANIDDPAGTAAEKQEVLGLIANKIPSEELEKHPLVMRAMENQRNSPEGPRWEDITPEYMAAREFNFPDERVVGYDRAREKLREQAENYSTEGPVRTDRRATIILGSPAAGKSSITKLIANLQRAAVPDADDVKQILPEYRNGFGSTSVHEESTLLNSMIIEDLAAQGKNLVLQKVGHNVNSIRELVDNLNALGYKVDLIHMAVDPDETYRRMIKRFINTGRLIEENYFKAIGDWPYKTFRQLISEGKINEAVNIDNNGRNPAVAEGWGSRLAEQISGRPGGRIGSSSFETGAGTQGGQRISLDQQPFYSAVERAVTTSKQDKASGDQWLAAIKNTPGVKQEELDWLGLPAFLKGRKSLSRQELQDYIAANKVELKEVTKTDQGDIEENIGEMADVIMRQWSIPQELRWENRQDGMVNIIDNNGNILNVVNRDTDANLNRIAKIEEENLNKAIEEENFDELFDLSQQVADNNIRAIPDGGPAKFTQYQLPGGTNYRELLLTLPVPETTFTREMGTRLRELERQRDPSRGLPDELEKEYQELNRKAEQSDSQQEPFRSSHWDEPNVLAHVRANDRVIDGKRTLFIEEIQSDWHQMGRKRGYVGDPPKQPEDIKAIAEKIKSATEKDVLFNPNAIGVREMNKLIDEGVLTSDEVVRFHTWRTTEMIHYSNAPIPNAPFKKTWHELALKRMIAEAAEKGYDQIAWTSGKVQAERYDLSKQVSQIEVGEIAEDTVSLTIRDLRGNAIPDLPRGQAMATSGEYQIKKADLEDVVGKDLAEKILNGEPYKTYEGADLAVGGEGMRGFYDKILVDSANRLGKPFGAKEGKAKLPKPEEVTLKEFSDWRTMDEDDFEAFSGAEEGSQIREIANQIQIKTPDGRVEAFDLEGNPVTPVNELKGADVHTLPITPELRRVATNEGFKLFQEGLTPQGRITLEENRALIQLFEGADQSTFMHEAGHLFLNRMVQWSERADAEDAIKKDLDVILNWLGLDDPKSIGREHHEAWARGFERYLAEGNAPTSRLKAIFDQFKQWLAEIYDSVALLGRPISDDVRAVMDRMFATDDELAALRVTPDMIPASLGAAAVGGADLAQLSIAGKAASGVAAATARINPAMRIANNSSVEARRVGFDLFEMTQYIKMNDESMASPQSVETLRKAWNAGLAAAYRATDDAYDAFVKTPSYQSNPLTRERFEDEVGKAMRREDTHAIPEVDAVAKTWRAKVFDPLKEEAIKLGLLPEDVHTTTALSYFSRSWNTRRLVAEEQDFKEVVSQHYKGVIAEEYKTSAINLQGRLNRLDQEIEDLNLSPEQRLQKLEIVRDDLKFIEESNEDHVARADRISELGSKMREARKAGDDKAYQEAREERAALRRAGGNAFKEFEKQRATLRSRIKNIDLGAAGLMERSDRILAQMADLEEANYKSMERLIKRGQRLERDLDRLDADALEEHIERLADSYGALARKAESSAERATKQIENLRARQEKISEGRDAEAAASDDPVKAERASQMVTNQLTVLDEKVAAKIEKEAEYQLALSERMRDIEQRLTAARNLDHDAVMAELKRTVDLTTREVSSQSMARGERIKSLGERLKDLDPKRVADRVRTIERMKAEAERAFYDRWEVRNLADVMDRRSAVVPDFTLAAREIADNVFDTLTGKAAGGVRPEFVTIGIRGPMKERTFHIPDEKVEQWLEHNVKEVGQRYTRIMGTDIELVRKFGSVDLKDQIDKINQDYQRLRADKSPEQRTRLEEERKRTIEDIEGVRDLLRGTYQQAAWEANFGRIAQTANAFNYIRMLGQVTLSSLGEAVRPAMVHGLSRYMETAFQALRNFDALKMSAAEAKLAGNIADRVLANRLATLADITDPYQTRGPILRFMDNMANVASTWNGIRLWTDSIRTFSSVITQNRLLRTIDNWAEAGAADKRWALFLGIDESAAARIKRYYNDFGQEVDGVAVANTEKWTGPDADRARRDYYAAVNKDLDSVVVNRSVADTPLFASSPIGRMVLQFNTFNVASHQRVLVRGLQEGPAKFIAGVVALTTMGMIITYLRAVAANRVNKLPNPADNPGWWIAEGIDNSGIFSIPFQVANAFEKIAGFNPIKAPITAFDEGNKGSDRIINRAELGAVLGPSFGTVQDIGESVLGARAELKRMITGQGEGASQRQKNAAERLLPFYSYVGVRQILKYFINPPQN